LTYVNLLGHGSTLDHEVQDRVGVVKGLNTRGAGDDLEMAQFISRQITPSS
jgi:hypothetical protein